MRFFWHIVVVSYWFTLLWGSGVRRKKFSSGFKVMAGLVGSPEAEPPDAGEMSKICKIQYFRLFWRIILKLCVKFSRVWTKNTIRGGNFEKILKIFDENSIEKLNFYLFLGKFVAKNRAFGNNIIFLQQCFLVGGVWTPHVHKVSGNLWHGRSQDFFFGGGGTLFQKNFQKIFKKCCKKFCKNL